MSGFLRRLARRTLHPTPAIHSQARLPYASPPAWDAAAPPLQSVGEIPATMDPTRTAAPHPPAAATPPSVTDSLSPPSVAADPVLPGLPMAHPTTAPVERARRALAEPEDRPPALRFSSQTQGPDPDRFANPAPRPVAGATDQTAERNFVSLVPAPIPGHESSPGRDGFDAPAATASLSSPVENRVLATRSSGHSPLLTRAAQRASADLEPADEAPTVHVTIGRIEITAVHAPPQPQPKPTPARQPMSLDDYLARRNRGRP